jgi:hypothetical protein
METLANRLRRHRGLLALLVTGLLVQVLINLLSSWLEQTMGETPAKILILIVAVGAAALVLWAVLQLLGREPPVEIVPEEEKAPRFPGLVALVGPGRAGADPMKQAAAVALEHHLTDKGPGEPLQVAWLVTSRGERGGVAAAEAYCNRYADRCEMHVRTVADPFDLQETYAVVRRIYREEVPAKGLRPEQVVADLTGGTGMMTAGVALACRDRWPMEYVTGGGRDEMVSAPVLVRWQPAAGPTGREGRE